ncbi:MAG: transposase [Saprospiraceae bacterium]|nr:transposase [Saprospiraceae bacterium]
MKNYSTHCLAKSQGRPNAPIRVLIGMMVLKEAFGLSDEKIFEDCRYNLYIVVP